MEDLLVVSHSLEMVIGTLACPFLGFSFYALVVKLHLLPQTLKTPQ